MRGNSSKFVLIFILLTVLNQINGQQIQFVAGHVVSSITQNVKISISFRTYFSCIDMEIEHLL